MQSNGNKKQLLNIIYPKNLGNAYPEALALCEIFIGSVINAKTAEINCSVNTELGYVECDVAEIKNILSLLLKTKKIREFYEQFKRLLHKIDNRESQKCLGHLKVVSNEISLNIYVTEETCYPDFKWKIVKSE